MSETSAAFPKSALDTLALLIDLDVLEANIAHIAQTCRAHGGRISRATRRWKSPGNSWPRGDLRLSAEHTLLELDAPRISSNVSIRQRK